MTAKLASQRDIAASVVPRTGTIEQTIPRMQKEAALVVDDNGVLCGLVTDGDLRRAFLAGADLATPVAEIMTAAPMTCRPETPDSEVRRLMLAHSIRHLPVVDDAGRPVGLELLKEHFDDIEDQAGAVIMAGGKGTRLRPLTLDTPKPLLRIGDRTILDNILDTLQDNGIRDVVLTVNYLAGKIRSHVGDHKRDMQIGFVEEDKQLGTAGSLALLDPRPTGSFLVMNADLLTELDFRSLVRFHHQEKHHLTVCVRREEIKVPYGVITLDDDCRCITGIEEKPTYRVLVNAGIYMLEPELIDLVPQGEFFDMVQLMEAALARGYAVGACPVFEYWQDIGRHEEWQRASREWVARRRRQLQLQTVTARSA